MGVSPKGKILPYNILPVIVVEFQSVSNIIERFLLSNHHTSRIESTQEVLTSFQAFAMLWKMDAKTPLNIPCHAMKFYNLRFLCLMYDLQSPIDYWKIVSCLFCWIYTRLLCKIFSKSLSYSFRQIKPHRSHFMKQNADFHECISQV